MDDPGAPLRRRVREWFERDLRRERARRHDTTHRRRTLRRRPARRHGLRRHPLTFWIDEATATDRLNTMLARLREHAPAAYFAERIDGTTLLAQVSSIRSPLSTAADADPRLDAIAWLAAAAPETFTAGEWAPDPAFVVDPADTGVGDVLFARMVRTHVGAVQWQYTYPDRYVASQGLTLLVDRTDTGWSLRDLSFDPVVVLAGPTDADLVTNCTPITPSSPLATHTFDGIEFDGCVAVGTYSYTAQPGDTVAIAPGISFALAPPVGGRAHWITSRSATLTVAAQNYWPRVAYSDAMCDSRVGWSVTIDAITGAIQRIQAGILCVVC